MGNVLNCICNCNWDFNQELRYILCPKRHAKTLRAQMVELNAMKEAIQREVDAKVTQEPGMTMRPQVSSWIALVDNLNTQVVAIVEGDLSFCRRLCCCYSYALGDQINQKLENVKQLKESRQTNIGSNLVMYTSQWTNNCKMLLKDEMQRLTNRKMDLERKVWEQEMVVDHFRRERTNLVKAWMEDVDSLDEEVRVLMVRIESSADQNELPAANGQQNHEISRMRGRVRDLSNQLEELEKKELVVMAPPERIHELPGPLENIVVGIDEKLKEVLELLDDDSVELIGIHGMGGAGKTTLVREITKKLRSAGDGGSFELVISVVVSQNLNIKEIQEEILTQLGYERDNLPHFQNERDRARFIWGKLCQKSFLLVLDDVWEPFALSKVGFRSSSKEMEENKKCKVMITSRSEDACASMEGSIHPPKILKVGLLRKDHAWDLFRRKIGNDLIETEEIRPLAEKIVCKCGGLPLVLKTVASAMAKNKTESDWVQAKSQLDHCSGDIKEMEDVYERLGFSFDRLSEELKSCLLYCAMFREDYNISIDEVIEYWIVEGFLEIKDPFDFDRRYWKARRDIIWRLQESSLLERGSSHAEHFKLHDAVREMVIWFGNNGREGNEQYKLLTRARKGLNSSIMVDKSWVGVKMVSLRDNDIEDVLVSSDGVSGEAMHVQTLLMNNNTRLRSLPENLFPLLSSLRTLDLSFTGLWKLPKSIGSLTSLQYLNVSYTHIKELPVEIGNLANLQFLNPSCTWFLRYIPQLAISPLKMLRFLYLSGCPCFERKEEGQLTLVDLSGLPQLIDVRLEVYHAGDVDSLLQSNTLSMSTSVLCFRNIHDVTIITRIENMQRLEKLEIRGCSHLRELLLKQESGDDNDESSNHETLLSHLKYMYLFDLPLLESISSGNMLFPCLIEMKVRDCPKLRKLPIKLCNSVRTKISCDKNWWESLEWGDDECNPSRFH